MSTGFACESEMGSGTYGVVFSARSPSGTRSAIKYNLKSEPCDFIGCLRELNINHQLSLHPHIIPLSRIAHGEPFQKSTKLKSEAGISRDKIHFIYPLAEGNLTDFLQRHTETTLPDLQRYMVELLLAVEYLHGLGYIHRDIKSDNILIMNENGQYHLRLADFGLAKPYNRFQVHTPGVVTCCYRPPEIVMGAQDYDQRADIWSLGCVFYEMVSGHPLIETVEDNNLEVLRIMSLVLPYHVSSSVLSAMDRTGISKLIEWKGSRLNREHFLGLKPGGGAIFEPCGGLNLFWDFLLMHLEFEPQSRCSAERALRHGWLESYRGYINNVRISYPPKERVYPRYKIAKNEQRSWVIDILISMWQKRGTTLTVKALFTSLAVMDRLLVLGLDKIETIICRKNVELIYLSCLYTSIKYHSSLHAPVSFSSVVGSRYSTPANIKSVERYESLILSRMLSYDYYHPTPYDILCRTSSPTERESFSLLFLMAAGHHHDRSGNEVVEFWHYHKSYYIKISASYYNRGR